MTIVLGSFVQLLYWRSGAHTLDSWASHMEWKWAACVVQRQLLAWQLLRELTVHMLAEEAVLYPVIAEQVRGCCC